MIRKWKMIKVKNFNVLLDVFLVVVMSVVIHSYGFGCMIKNAKWFSLCFNYYRAKQMGWA